MKAVEFKLIREELKLTKAEIAEILKVTRRSILRWEQGEYAIPPEIAKKLQDLCAEVNTKVDFLTNKINKNLSTEVIRLVSFSMQEEADIFGIKNYKMHNLVNEKFYLKCLNYKGVKPEIVFFDAQCYMDFLKYNTELDADSLSTLQAWGDQVVLEYQA